jgi:hypothetical protein
VIEKTPHLCLTFELLNYTIRHRELAGEMVSKSKSTHSFGSLRRLFDLPNSFHR